MLFFSSVLIVVLLLVDLYVFKGLKVLVNPLENACVRKGIKWGFWLLTAGLVIYLLWIMKNAGKLSAAHDYRHFYAIFGLVVLFLVPKLVFVVFHLLDDITFALIWTWKKLTFTPSPSGEGIAISRAVFITRIGLAMAAIPFISIIYGLLKGKFDFRVIRQQLKFDELPPNFHGFTIAHISDAHLGSFLDNKQPVQKAIEMINKLEADIVVFTGDLVNNYADEAENWVEVFKGIRARKGKYSIMGNHDYADYVRWEDTELKRKNFKRLQEIHAEMGFKLLMNAHERITIDGQELSLIGVENWGKPPFPQYGNLNKATAGLDSDAFKVLLSHDPSHWDEEVIKKTNIHLTLSGHTHGMQFGIEIAGFRWSPVKYKYPRWAGLYTEGQQHLYVNRGFGYLGFPGRVGMPPEITLLELYKA